MSDPRTGEEASDGARAAGAVPGEVRAIVLLAAPVALSRAGGLLLIIIDVIMLGRVDSTALAYYGLANSLMMVPYLIGVGMLVGIAVLTAQARGAGRERECGTIWRIGLSHALLIGTLCLLFGFAGDPILRLLGQSPDLARGGGAALAALGLGLPGGLGFTSCAVFLEAMGRPRISVVVMFAANLVNLALNAALIEGWFGVALPAAVAVALATSITRTTMVLVLVVYILRLPERRPYNLTGALEGAWQVSVRLRRLGYGFGLAQGLESAAFASLTMFAGYLGASAVAGYQIVLNVMAFVFMVAIGVATATGVGVGHAVGRQDRPGVPRAGWSGVATIFVFMAIVGGCVRLWPGAITWLFSDDATVQAMALPALLVAALMLMPDGMQAVLMGALRGAGDVWVPTTLHLFAFIGVMMPAAWYLAIHQQYGLPGLIGGGLLGVGTATLLLGGRFLVISRRAIIPV